MRLDKNWEMSSISCPYCDTRLLRDTHEDKEATHYCSKCDDGLTIVPNAIIRGKIK